MLEAFVAVPVGRASLKDNSESVEAAVTPYWQKQQMGVNNAEDRSNGGLAPPVSHRFVMG